MRHYYNPSNFKQYKPRRAWRWRFWNLFKGGRRRRVVQYSQIGGRQYLNPWKRRNYDWRGRFFGGVLILTVLSWLGLIIYLPYFRITGAAFEGLKIIKEEEISRFVRDNYLIGSKIWPKNNYFLVSAGQIKNDLLKRYSLDGVEVKKNFPSRLDIKVEEKISSIIYDNGQSYYLLDKQGNVIKYLSAVDAVEFKPITPASATATPAFGAARSAATSTATSTLVSPLRRGSERGSELAVTSTTSTVWEHVPDFKRIKKDFGAFPLVFDRREQNLNDGQTRVLPAELIGAVIDWYGALEKRGIAGVKYFTVEQPAAGLTVYTNLPWRLHVNPLDNLENQLENLKIILRSNNPRDYIDLRYGERVFWK